MKWCWVNQLTLQIPFPLVWVMDLFSLLRFLTFFFLFYDLLSSMKKNKTLTYSSKATAAYVFKLFYYFTVYLKIQAKLSRSLTCQDPSLLLFCWTHQLMRDGVMSDVELLAISHLPNKCFHKYLHYNGTGWNLNQIIHVRVWQTCHWRCRLSTPRCVCVFDVICECGAYTWMWRYMFPCVYMWRPEKDVRGLLSLLFKLLLWDRVSRWNRNTLC